MGWEVVYFIVALILSVALAPKPPDAKPAALDDFEFPVAEEGRPIPVIFGDVIIRGPNVLWYGGLWASQIRKRSGFSKTTIGYKYYMGFFLGLCHGPVDVVKGVEIGEKPWTFLGPGSGELPLFTNGSRLIRNTEMFGGEKQEGGINGYVVFFFGGPTQTITEPYFSHVRAHQTNPNDQSLWPAHRGILTMLWRGGYIGTTKYPKPWAVRASRTTKGWNDDTVWYPEKCTITFSYLTGEAGASSAEPRNHSAMNVIHIIYECMTNRAWGRGLPVTRINDASFRAAADTAYNEAFGLRFIWNQSITIEQFIQMMLDHVAGALIYRPATGQFEMKLIRDDYDIGALPEADESNIISLDMYQRQAWGETVNELHLKYFDPATAKDRSITGHDLANIQIQGGTNTETLEFKGVRNHGLAQRILIRELSARSTPLAKVEFTMNRSGWDFHQGDVVKWSWAKLGIANMALRILKIERGSITDNRIKIVAVQDIFSIDSVTYLVTPPAEDVPVDPPGTENNDSSSDSNGVISTSLTSPPVSPSDGDRYYIQPGTGTGAWTGMEGLVEWDAEADYDPETETYTGAWIEIELNPGQIIYDEDTGTSVVVGTVGTTESAWAPHIPPLDQDLTPDPDDLDIVAYDNVNEEYVKVSLADIPPKLEIVDLLQDPDEVIQNVDRIEFADALVVPSTSGVAVVAYTPPIGILAEETTPDDDDSVVILKSGGGYRRVTIGNLGVGSGPGGGDPLEWQNISGLIMDGGFHEIPNADIDKFGWQQIIYV